MKRVLAVLLLLCMTFALFACGDKNSPSGSSSSPSGSNIPPPKEIGFYDRDYDYTQHKEFRFVYLVSNVGAQYDMFNVDFQVWAKRLNMDYAGMWGPATSGDQEAYLSGVETHADMGFDAIIIDCDEAIGARAVEILESRGIPWFQCMTQVRDRSMPYVIGDEHVVGTMLGPSVSFNHTLMGKEMANKLMDWKEETYPEIPWEQVGYIAVTFSPSTPLHARALGAEQVWAERLPQFGSYDPSPDKNPRNFVVADAASTTFDAMGATNLVTQILSDPPDPNIKVWLIQCAVYDQALGASIAAENMGMIDYVATTTMGSGDMGLALWKSGVPTTIRFTLETAFPVYAESIINSLWAMAAGYTTKETLWRDWCNIRDKGDVYETGETDPFFQAPKVVYGSDGKPVVKEEHNYASMLLPSIWVGQDNYIDFCGWTDLYDFGPDATDEERKNPEYPIATDINLFDARGTVPAYYHEYP